MKIASYGLRHEQNEFICWNLINVWQSVDKKTLHLYVGSVKNNWKIQSPIVSWKVRPERIQIRKLELPKGV